MQLSNHDNHLFHYYTQLIMMLLCEFINTHGAIHLASKLLLFITKVASSNIKVALKKHIKTYPYEI